jgi:hypothetical protein
LLSVVALSANWTRGNVGLISSLAAHPPTRAPLGPFFRHQNFSLARLSCGGVPYRSTRSRFIACDMADMAAPAQKRRDEARMGRNQRGKETTGLIRRQGENLVYNVTLVSFLQRHDLA